MPVHLETCQHAGTGLHSRDAPATFDHGSNRCIRIGLLNNMPDAALKATERQFVSILASAAKDLVIHLSLYAAPDVPRGASAAAYLKGRYSSIENLWNQRLDGLIVTGAEPVRPDLVDEPFWPMLAKLTDWARDNTRSTIWSCLAAHAAVLKMNGIDRSRSTLKYSGIFACERLNDHPLTQGLPLIFHVPHSRWNGLAQPDLASCGYQVLTRMSCGGVDMFAKKEKSLFVYFQGHPEYERDTLLREYRRDVARYLKGEIEKHPLLPSAYFNSETADALVALRNKALSTRSELLLLDVSHTLREARIADTWHSNACRIYKNWLQQISGDGLAPAIPSRRASCAYPA